MFVDPISNGVRKQRDRISRFRFARWINEAGDVVSLSERTASCSFWADLYDGREGVVDFGHEPLFDAPRRFAFARGLDGGCVFGGALLAAVWTGADQLEPNIVRQPSLRKYAGPFAGEEDE